jgi:16S rRNA (guanine527-N7)-methyltransferase
MAARPADERTELVAGAAALGVTLDDAQARQQLRLLDELADWAQRYNLTAIRERERMLTLHTLDSLAAGPLLHGSAIADIGTGAGFPGLPLAIAYPARRFTLVDATAKKLRFVEHARQTLQLTNAVTQHARVEQQRRSGAGFDTIVVRALARLPELARLAAPLLAPGGRLVALKGKRPEAELESLPGSWRLAELRRVAVPGLDAERHLVVLTRAGGSDKAAAPGACPSDPHEPR